LAWFPTHVESCRAGFPQGPIKQTELINRYRSLTTGSSASRRSAPRHLEYQVQTRRRNGLEKALPASASCKASSTPDQWTLLLIFQAMDRRPGQRRTSSTSCLASIPGLRGLLLQAPRPEELDHDFLWRTTGAARAGALGIFNRSYYEEVLDWCASTPSDAGRNCTFAGHKTSGRTLRESMPQRFLTRNASCAPSSSSYLKQEQRERLLSRLDSRRSNGSSRSMTCANVRNGAITCARMKT